MQRLIDLRSDTVTQPTAAMRRAMAEAPVGDDLFGDDPTVAELEALAARRLGKQAALFLPSGTMGNQVAVMTHTTPGNEIIVGANCHIVQHELGAAARLSGVAYAVVSRPDDRVTAADITSLARSGGDNVPATGLVCLENALGNGTVVPLPELQAAYAAAQAAGAPVHLDGARIFNAALALGVDAADIAACADSVMFCVSKGLCAPVGSLLCGSREFVQAARKNRRTLGGGMRQAGVLAACGLVALQEMTARLAEDHETAQTLGRLLAAIPGIAVQQENIQINMVFWRAANPAFSSADFVQYMLAHGVKVLGEADGAYRFVTNHDVTPQDVQTAAAAVAAYVASL